jgi:hypothetical protein
MIRPAKLKKINWKMAELLRNLHANEKASKERGTATI